MEKGISPVIAVVLLIAISVIAAVGVWYWVADMGAKPSGADPGGRQAISIEDCNLEQETVRVRSTGGVMVTENVDIYDSADKIGEIQFEIHRLKHDEVRYIPINLDEGEELDSGVEYQVIGNLPAVTFTC